MPRLIDADALILEINELPYRVHGKAINLIAKQPTIEERKTGEWEISVDLYGGEDCKCPVCGQRECAPYWNFCPNCGADMRGGQP